MDQRIGMDEFDRAGRCIEQRRVATNCLSSRIHKDCPDPFAAVENGVAHSFVEALRFRGLARQRASKACLIRSRYTAICAGCANGGWSVVIKVKGLLIRSRVFLDQDLGYAAQPDSGPPDNHGSVQFSGFE